MLHFDAVSESAMDVLAILGVFTLSLTLGLLAARAILGTILHLMVHGPSLQPVRRIATVPQPASAFLAEDVGIATVRAAG